MQPDDRSAEFEGERSRLQALAERILGRREEAEEVVQEAWLSLHSHGPGRIRTEAGWLTTVVTRLCLDELRKRKRREGRGKADKHLSEYDPHAIDPEAQVVLADAVGAALLIVLDRLKPAERVAFVLHDVFGLPFEEVAALLERSPAATRQLASRARRRVRGAPVEPTAVLLERRRISEHFLWAARRGDLPALLKLLDPEVVLRADDVAAALPAGPGRALMGAMQVAGYFAEKGAGAAHVALLNGRVGIIVAPRDQLLLILHLEFRDQRIVGLEASASPEHLAKAEIALA